MDGVIIALVGLLSAVVGGLLQATATGKFERVRFRRQAKWDLYSAYFVTLGELTFTEVGSPTHKAALATMAQVRARIALVGTGEVIQAVARVFTFPSLQSDDAQIAMAHALRAMRRDIGDVDCVINERLLQALMFGSEKDA
jgi:hypothetical protein